ncbi:hypothetical protein DSO57_1033302 [Entomophthora muscae]|uniref:Uncharacterized protein n=1 Tax=Entomophthora muscae TaxID=34485 RepID=A0ACC2SD41_9FUNG|nr:hypothetical protein DSO57_1033302 [Entomophthora muscae]
MVAQVAKSSFVKTWYRLEVAPLIIIVGGALGGTGWYFTRLCRNVDAVWDRKNNPHPWQKVDQNTNLKLYSVNKDFEKKYKRGSL